MMKQVSKKVKNKKKNIGKDMYNAVPDDIKIVFGKFYTYSFIYLIFFSYIYPFILLGNINDFIAGLVVGFLFVFYIYMILDAKKKIKHFSSWLYSVLIVLVFLSMFFSVIKFFI